MRNVRALGYAATIATITAVLVMAMSCSNGQDTVEADLARAKTAYQAGDLDLAQRAARSAYDARPEDVDARATLASVHRRRGRLAAESDDNASAHDAYETAATYEPYRAARSRDLLNSIEHGENAGMSSEELVDVAVAAAEADPSNSDARSAAARHLDNANRSDDALPHYLWLWEADSSDPRVGMRLAAIYASAGEHDDAVVVFERILSAQPRNVQASIGLASALEARGLNRKAHRVYENLLANNAGNPGILFRFADFLERRGDTQRAEMLREEARESMPGVKRRRMRNLR